MLKFVKNIKSRSIAHNYLVNDFYFGDRSLTNDGNALLLGHLDDLPGHVLGDALRDDGDGLKKTDETLHIIDHFYLTVVISTLIWG